MLGIMVGLFQTNVSDQHTLNGRLKKSKTGFINTFFYNAGRTRMREFKNKKGFFASPFSILYFSKCPLTTHHSPLVIRHSPFATRHLPLINPSSELQATGSSPRHCRL
jgi:hypothetical protein